MNFERLEQVLAAALTKASAEELESYLSEACGSDAAFRVEIEKLIRAHGLSGQFLEEPVAPVVEEPVGERAGDTIGRYKLLEELGEGGFGLVFLAEQKEPFHRKVALKIIKAGMDTREIVARFEAERQALALMDHPNIARVFDAGATETGRPYFVMEWVQGVPITEYCDDHGASVTERLLLFMEVCQAVQHAHQKGIVHRDLKPGNVLVTLVDGQPVPKVIDFGVAKALGQKLTEKTLFTSTFQMVGTPAYMSPEQAGMGGVDIDTRSDIYSLGVLLYELLAGVTPFDPQMLHSLSLEEIRRLIREAEPPKPSVRLRSISKAPADVPKGHGTDPLAVARAIEGDLDWIVMKCLEKDRGRRYAAANALEQDIHRHLRNEPVSAAAPGRLYRAHKFVLRHRVGLAVGGAFFAFLLAGTLVSARQAVLAARALRDQEILRKRAEAESIRSKQVERLFREMLAGASPSVALGRDTVVLREILDKTAARVGTELTNQPEAEVTLRIALAETYHDLGEFQRGRDMASAALEVARTRLGQNTPETMAALSVLATTTADTGEFGAAQPLAEMALSICSNLFGSAGEDAAAIKASLGRILCRTGKLQDGERMLSTAVDVLQRHPGRHERETSDALLELARLFIFRDLWEEAERRVQEALAIRAQVPGPDTPAYADALSLLGEVLLAQNKLKDAEAAGLSVLKIRRKTLPEAHPELSSALRLLGSVRLSQNKVDEALKLNREALDIAVKSVGNDHPVTCAVRNELGMVLWRQGDLAQAEQLLRLAYHPAPGHPYEIQSAMGRLIDLLMEQKKFDEVEGLFQEFAIFQHGVLDPGGLKQEDAPLLHHRAAYHARRGMWAKAVPGLREATRLIPNNHVNHMELAVVLAISGDSEGYRHECQSLTQALRAKPGPHVARQIVAICLLLPNAGVDLPELRQHASEARNSRGLSPELADVLNALADVRLSQFSSSVEFARRAAEVVSPEDLAPYIRAQAWCLIAIGEQRMDRPDTAQQAYARAVAETRTNLPRVESGDLGKRWRDWAVVQLLLQEARALVRPSGEA